MKFSELRLRVLPYAYFTSKIGEKAVRGRQLSTAASLSVHIQQNSAINFYTFPRKDQEHVWQVTSERTGLFKPRQLLYGLLAAEFKLMGNQLIGCFHQISKNKYFLPRFQLDGVI